MINSTEDKSILLEPTSTRVVPDAKGRLADPVMHQMLLRMLRIRFFDERAAELRPKLAGPLHNSIGQEAEIVGACMALRDGDYMTGNHRSHGHPIGKGVS